MIELKEAVKRTLKFNTAAIFLNDDNNSFSFSYNKRPTNN